MTNPYPAMRTPRTPGQMLAEIDRLTRENDTLRSVCERLVKAETRERDGSAVWDVIGLSIATREAEAALT